MIKSFTDKQTALFAQKGKHPKLPPEIWKRARMRLIQLDQARTLNDLRLPPSNRLEALKGDRQGFYSIRINAQWRICFRFEAGSVYDVEITDYH